ncbi:MAG: peptide chain release factor N(5)-glutamine methyltransferase [Pseudomonadota bacterium]|jgi:release factor glutamine methyltransferase
MKITIQQLLLQQDNLSRLDKRVLLSTITGFTPTQLITHDDFCLSVTQLNQYQEWLKRAQAGEPIAYIIGSKEFYSRQFKVTDAVLIPRPETELLVEQVLNLAPQNAQILELGTGSGCIAISLALERVDLSICAVDKSTEALAIAKINASNLQAKLELKFSDWYSELSQNSKYSIIVSNPPYIEANDQHLANLSYEPISALTDFADGLACLRQIIHQAPNYLIANGILILEHGYNQGAAVRQLLTNNGFKCIQTLTDYAGLERISYGYYLV